MVLQTLDLRCARGCGCTGEMDARAADGAALAAVGAGGIRRGQLLDHWSNREQAKIRRRDVMCGREAGVAARLRGTGRSGLSDQRRPRRSGGTGRPWGLGVGLGEAVSDLRGIRVRLSNNLEGGNPCKVVQAIGRGREWGGSGEHEMKALAGLGRGGMWAKALRGLIRLPPGAGAAGRAAPARRPCP